MNVETDKISKEQYQELIDEMYSWACSNGEYEWYAMDSDGTILVIMMKNHTWRELVGNQTHQTIVRCLAVLKRQSFISFGNIH